MKTEWVVVKGIKCYASENQSSSYEWDVFASVMAASVVSNILRNPSVFQHWSHYNEDLVTGGIPWYVLVGGPSVFKAYQRGLEFGKTYDKRTKILLIGQDRVGKTSLRKHLQGVKFDRDETSTSGVEMMPAVKNAAKQAWKNPASFESTSAFHHKCAELINKELSRSSPEKSHSARQLRGEDDFPNKESGTEEPRGDGLTPIVDTESTKDMKKRQGHEHKAEPMPRKVSSLANSGSTTPIQSKVTIK
ncbi:uncharacterized protein LOC111338008 [Stylophora pistillata]|uniref:uncharacterized protein LOC111338008 n=1 Tax=Stylophora pistillata TaxID=50429 RepID=UPI000C048ADD|nr:uncharacterized protein LOC111338008 [Stylophora pistillata]